MFKCLKTKFTKEERGYKKRKKVIKKYKACSNSCTFGENRLVDMPLIEKSKKK